jgi:glutamate-5-semialdehyde dehydrogenase
MRELGHRARAATVVLAQTPRSAKDAALEAAADILRREWRTIEAANGEDMRAAESQGLSAPLLDRLRLDQKRILAMADGLTTIVGLPDPVGRELARWQRPNGLDIARVTVPLGVIGIIYESRPNVTADAGALCLKAGNACILRGGKESFRSSRAIIARLQEGLEAAGLPAAAIQAVPTQDRAAVGHLLRMEGLVDVIVPRGGRSLIERVQAESRIPVFAHLDGNCHVYLHASADPAQAREVVLNAKLRRVGVCGAAESLLCDASRATDLLPPILSALIEAGCEVRGDPDVCRVELRAVPAEDEDWGREYLDAIISVKLVAGLDEAIAHINRYGSHHTDSIIATHTATAERFLREVDSAIVLHNASTQFADGGEFGMGAEIGIATGRLHARGPVGLEQLTTYKYLVRGNGQIRPG